MDDNGFEGINVIPLVDVMLVLLTIVLTTSTFIITGAIPVELPKAVNSSAEITTAVTIRIDRQGSIFLDSKASNLKALQQQLVTINRQQPVLIQADRSINLQRFVEVMDVVKGLGFSKVSLQTEGAP